MDLIGNLTSSLGIQPDQAQALAGSLLGGLKSQVQSEVGDNEAQAFDQAIPELGQWGQQAAKMLGSSDVTQTDSNGLMDLVGSLAGGGNSGGGGGALGGLLGAATSLLGGGSSASAKAGGFDIGQLIGLLGALNVDPAKSTDLGGNMIDFLKARLSNELMETLSEKIPMLSVFTGRSGGGLGGLLSSFLNQR